MPRSFKILNNVFIALMLITLSAALIVSMVKGPDAGITEISDEMYRLGIMLLLMFPIINLIYLSVYLFVKGDKKIIVWGFALIIILTLGTLLLHKIR